MKRKHHKSKQIKENNMTAECKHGSSAYMQVIASLQVPDICFSESITSEFGIQTKGFAAGNRRQKMFATSAQVLSSSPFLSESSWLKLMK
jgi:hypothetical protein